MSVEKFIPLLTEHPAKFLQVDDRKGKLAISYDADLTIWNPDEKYNVQATDIMHRYDCSPYVGENLFGTVKETIVNGITVYQDKKIIEEKWGRLILRKLCTVLK